MRWLLFLSRLAFICGFCFLVSLVFQIIRTDMGTAQPIAGTIIIIGFVIGIIVVPLTLLFYLVALMFKKEWLARVPIWLIVCNVLFLIALLVYIIGVNVKDNHPA
jgi:hypothetical protein